MSQLIKDVMSHLVISCNDTDSALMAAKKMKERGVGFLPVLRNGLLCGVVTDRDLILRCIAEDKDPQHTEVSACMTAQVYTIKPSNSVIESSRFMASKKIRRLPVCENDRVVGVVSLGDFARAKGMFAETATALCEICRE